MPKDIPIAEAMIIWDGDGLLDPPVRVVQSGGEDDQRYPALWGACNMDFRDADPATKILMLLQQFHWMVLGYGLAPTVVHEALLVIPEYRENIAPELVPESFDSGD